MQRSQATFVDIIAEYDAEDDYIRLELELGSNDVGAFRNLLPGALDRGTQQNNLYYDSIGRPTTDHRRLGPKERIDWVRKSGEWGRAC